MIPADSGTLGKQEGGSGKGSQVPLEAAIGGKCLGRNAPEDQVWGHMVAQSPWHIRLRGSREIHPPYHRDYHC